MKGQGRGRQSKLDMICVCVDQKTLMNLGTLDRGLVYKLFERVKWLATAKTNFKKKTTDIWSLYKNGLLPFK